MSSSSFPKLDTEVSDYLNQILPNSSELIIKAHNLGFRFFIGFLKSEENSGLIDTVITHSRYPHMVIGIRTLMKYPFFKFVWDLRQNHGDVMISSEFNSILDTYNAVYSQLVNYFPCVLINRKANPIKVIFDDKYNVFVIDINSYKGFIADKLTVQKHRYIMLDRSECIQDTETVKFKLGDVTLTVKQYVQIKYLIEFYKLALIYENARDNQ